MQTDDERPTFRPFTRESLAKIEARIQEHNAKNKDLERKRAEGEVRFFQKLSYSNTKIYIKNLDFLVIYYAKYSGVNLSSHFFWRYRKKWITSKKKRIISAFWFKKRTILCIFCPSFSTWNFLMLLFSSRNYPIYRI